jgi:predicted outer membrane protein
MHIAKTIISACLFAAFAAFVLPEPAAAQQQWRDPKVFTENMLVDIDLEVRKARLAADRAQDRDVREYAEDVAQRLRTIGNDLREVAEDARIDQRAIEAQIGDRQRQVLAQFEDARDRDFDRLYLANVRGAFDNMATAFRMHGENGTNPRLREFAHRRHGTIENIRGEAADLAKEAIEGGR